MFISLLLAVTCSCSKPVSLKVEVCTPENVVKALKLAKQFLPQEYKTYDGGYVVASSAGTLTWIQSATQPEPPPGADKRAQAKQLIKEADELDQRDADAKFIRKVLKACEDE